jgi:hypothetical protein
LNRIGRRTVMCMLLIVALAVIWNLLKTEEASMTQPTIGLNRVLPLPACSMPCGSRINVETEKRPQSKAQR